MTTFGQCIAQESNRTPTHGLNQDVERRPDDNDHKSSPQLRCVSLAQARALSQSDL